MKMKKTLFALALIFIAVGIFLFLRNKKTPENNSGAVSSIPVQENISSDSSDNQTFETKSAPQINFVGPRGNVGSDAPMDGGFWSLAVMEPGIISRSGQPTLKDFQWLKNNGWKGVVDLRIDGDHGEVSDDADIPGFNSLNFNYLKIQIADGSPPTNDQAKEFLNFVTNPDNQPAHIHCRGGYGRAGTMAALYRYAVDGWPVEKAIEESKLFHGGIDEAQQKWLATWAAQNLSGSW